jgi:hypothetical protein
MRIKGIGNETFLYLNGIGVSRPVCLRDNIMLLPANCSVDTTTILNISKNQGEFGIALIFLWLVKSQLHITAENPDQLAKRAWNSLWDAILLSAIFSCPAVCNFQCDKPVEEITSTSDLIVTNYHLRGLTISPYYLSEEDNSWIENNHDIAFTLLKDPKFSNAVHCLATYHWHSLANAQLALIWSGIEGLFNINSELIFRLSLYIANFLDGENLESHKKTFTEVKRLYNFRSKAVHGSINSRNKNNGVDDSAKLLKALIIKCIIDKKLPDTDELVF